MKHVSIVHVHINCSGYSHNSGSSLSLKLFPLEIGLGFFGVSKIVSSSSVFKMASPPTLIVLSEPFSSQLRLFGSKRRFSHLLLSQGSEKIVWASSLSSINDRLDLNVSELNWLLERMESLFWSFERSVSLRLNLSSTLFVFSNVFLSQGLSSLFFRFAS